MASLLPGQLQLVAFENSPFPYDGLIPEAGQRFLENDDKGAFHLSPRGGKLYEEATYRDRRSLLYIPSYFDLHGPEPTLVLFLHGNLATLRQVVIDRQHVPQQLEASGMNAVLVAPQPAPHPGRHPSRCAVRRGGEVRGLDRRLVAHDVFRQRLFGGVAQPQHEAGRDAGRRRYPGGDRRPACDRSWTRRFSGRASGGPR